MARSRNIKPSFFKNYDLADIGPHAQLLFAGLWCLADKEGRLEDKPRFIKAELFPYYDVDINGELTQLERLNFIRRYKEAGILVIEIMNFKKHQNPHHTEKASELPEFKETSIKSSDYNINGELTVNSPCCNGGNPADSLILIPDSLHSGTNVPVVSSKPADSCPHNEILKVYAELLPSCTQPKIWNGTRQQNLRSRWREDKKRQSLDYWRRLFNYISQSDFLMGRTSGSNGKAFMIGLDWIVKAENFNKIIEGKYHHD